MPLSLSMMMPLSSRSIQPHSLSKIENNQTIGNQNDVLINELISVKVKLAEVKENLDFSDLQRNREVKMLQSQMRYLSSTLGIASDTPRYEMLRNVTSPSPRPEDVADEKVQYLKR
jgi:hypothetical protein